MLETLLSWILTIVVFLPLAGALVVLVLPENSQRTARTTALVCSLLTLVLAAAAAWGFFNEISAAQEVWGFALEKQLVWIGNPEGDSGWLADLEISYHVGVDGISIWLLILTALLSPLAIASSFSCIRERVREYYALMLILQTGMMGVFCALDLILFYIFFEFTLIPLFFIIGIWGGPERRRAANKFFIYTVAGSVLTFAGILYLAYICYVRSGSTTLTFDLPALYSDAAIPANVQWWLFLAFFAGFAIKVPLFPFHTWLPLAHTEAPTAGSVLLAGVLLKLGTYGFLRISIPLLPSAALTLAPFMAVLAIAGIIYGALVAWVQQDVKKLVAYSSVSHLGFCMLGMFSLKMAGLSGSVLYMINHGLSTAALFLLVGMIYERYHTRDMAQIGGLSRPMPWLAFFLIFFTFSSIGLPGLNGFVSEFLVLLGTVMSPSEYDSFRAGALGYGYAIPAAMGIVLGAIYMLRMCQRVLFGPVVEPPGTPDTSLGLSRDLNRREIGILVPIAVCCVLIGVYPKSLQHSIEPAIRANILATARLNELSTFSSAVGVPRALDEAAADGPLNHNLRTQRSRKQTSYARHTRPDG